MSYFATLRLERADGLARLTLDRPERHGMTNRMVREAFEARAMGLVARVYDDEVFGASVEALLDELLGRSPVALRTLKAHYLAGERMAFSDFVDLETEHHVEIGRMADTREAFRAFLDKRKPVLTGR